MLLRIFGCIGRGTLIAIRRPWMTVTLLTALMVDACSLPSGSHLGALTPSVMMRCGCRRPWNEAVAVQEGESIRLLTEDEAYELPADAVIASITCQPRSRRSGVWAITRETWDPTLRVTPMARALTKAEMDQARAQYADMVEREQWSSQADFAQMIRNNATPEHRVLWRGYLHNAITVLVGTLSVLSMTWIRDHMRVRQARLALAAGFCPACRYDLRGDLDAGCPECGWRRTTA
jgi:hypothetical protein